MQRGIDQIIEECIQNMSMSRRDFIDFLKQSIPNMVNAFEMEGNKQPELTTLKIANLILNQFEYKGGYVELVSTPFFLCLDPSNACQLRCPGCVHSPSVIPAVNWNNSLLDEKSFKAFVDYYGPASFGMYLYNYGEPFLNKHTYSMIKYAKKFGSRIAISSNLSIPIDAEALVESDLDGIICSIDGATQEIYELYRRGGKLKVVEENLSAIKQAKEKLKKKTPVVTWQFLTFEHNYHEVELAHKKAEQLGVDLFLVGSPFSVQWDDPSIKEIKSEEAGWYSLTSYDYEYFINHLNQAFDNTDNQFNKVALCKFEERLSNYLNNPDEKKCKPYCKWQYTTIVLDACGRILPCCTMPKMNSEEHDIMGTLNVDNTGSEWNFPKYKLLRGDDYYMNQCINCAGRNTVIFDTKQVYSELKRIKAYSMMSEKTLIRLTQW